jgi:hypothetical protein
MSDSGACWASVVLPFAVDVAERAAVPVQVRTQDGRLAGWMRCDGQYHPVPTGWATFVATIPDGLVMQAAATLVPGESARITLQGDLRRSSGGPPAKSNLLEQQKTALRFYLQRSIDSYERSYKPTLGSVTLAATDALRLDLASHAAGVQFLQLLTPGAIPVNVAHAGKSSVKLVRLERRFSADLSTGNGAVQLALAYLQHHRAIEAQVTLELQGMTLQAAEGSHDMTVAVGVLHVFLAAGGRDEVEATACRLAEEHVYVSDFRIIAAECAANRGDHRAALTHLTRLEESGLPLLYRSYAMATLRLAEYAARGFRLDSATHPHASQVTPDVQTLAAVDRRLQELAPHVDPASSLLLVEGYTPRARPASSRVIRWTIRMIRPITQWVGRRTAPYFLSFTETRRDRAEVFPMSDAPISTSSGAPAAPLRPPTVNSTERASPSRIAVSVALAALVLWVAFAVFLLVQSGANEVKWARLAWVFGSVEAVAFAAAGLVFGTTVNRERAERAEVEAESNRKAAEGGRAIAAALKADEPAVVREGAPRPLGEAEGSGDTAAVQIAARHARLARELFP